MPNNPKQNPIQNIIPIQKSYTGNQNPQTQTPNPQVAIPQAKKPTPPPQSIVSQFRSFNHPNNQPKPESKK